MNEGVIAEWLVQDGSAVREGQPIYSIESDKSVQEIESPASGVLRIIGRVGETYQVGAVIAEILRIPAAPARCFADRCRPSALNPQARPAAGRR
jgi:pyruvate/2-oxoglutarate dehydrogenase complex dihydrolipoamide acyltransferase (E2) component